MAIERSFQGTDGMQDSSLGKRARPESHQEPSGQSDVRKTLEEARKRAQEAFKRSGLPNAPTASAASRSASAPNSAAPLSASGRTGRSDPNNEREKIPTEIHPLLLGDAARIQEKIKSLAPKFASLQRKPGVASSTSATRHPQQLETKPTPTASQSSAAIANPYLSETAREDEPAPKRRSMHRALQFHRPGRYVMEAEQLRREEQMNALKERIQERARKAGMRDELLGDERALWREAPPEHEWWDLPLLPPTKEAESSQDQDPPAGTQSVPTLAIDHLIQHPIPIPSPMGLLRVKPKGIMLTKQEMKKMRKQRRAAEQQDKRDRIKMGLLPPDPPKVKLTNLMRVLSSEAIADPTKVEARVRREVTARREQHERTNFERMLTDDQRQQRRMYKTKVEEDKGIWCQVYCIRHLVNPSHKFKVRKNAQQHHLGGIIITHPELALVVVEGSAKSLKAYKRLMLVRIDWNDLELPDETGKDQESDAFSTANHLGPSQADATPNRCELVFEGPVRERRFQGGIIRTEACPTEYKVKELLGSNLTGYWEVARQTLSTSQRD
ncbi:U4/U5/U6 small nuclear ribonucleoprotein prp3 [Malassezia yamatoensis]|uniref:U4/U5/U6 small nuclear ribonucleoprotein prp3 n=1 Tax=Malassezia yamatoensis TaxID=253288 RepID=A0AAJ5YSR5_9BASI|nr:U4/U5/U6 small nuclear ribonucleoprotein prp3 [Malassezia yamatoensis]